MPSIPLAMVCLNREMGRISLPPLLVYKDLTPPHRPQLDPLLSSIARFNI